MDISGSVSSTGCQGVLPYELGINCKTLNIKANNLCFLGKDSSNFIMIYFNKEKVKLAVKAGVSGAAGKGNDYRFEQEFSFNRSLKKIAITQSNNLALTFDPESDDYKNLRASVIKARLDVLAQTDPDSVKTFEFKIHGGASRFIGDIQKFYPALDLSAAVDCSDEAKTAKIRKISENNDEQIPSSSSSKKETKITKSGAASGQTGHLANLDIVFSCSSLHLGTYVYTDKNSVIIEKRMVDLAEDPKISIYMRDHKDENTVELKIPFQKDGNYFFTDGQNKNEMVLFFSLTSAINLSTQFGNYLKYPILKNVFDPCSEVKEKKYIILAYKMKDVDEVQCLQQIVEKFGTNIRILSSMDPIAQLVSNIITKNLSNQKKNINSTSTSTSTYILKTEDNKQINPLINVTEEPLLQLTSEKEKSSSTDTDSSKVKDKIKTEEKTQVQGSIPIPTRRSSSRLTALKKI